MGIAWLQCRLVGAVGRGARALRIVSACLTLVRGYCAAQNGLVLVPSARGHGFAGLRTVSASQAVGTFPVRANTDRITGDSRSE